ncbi:fasciclin domain-containing protein [Agaribacterium haliotis]|uniref:fasciclin domain-containing protein n=1 Tax=Agaribacterium haliotis TaxID=2013869 RepID=UPI000BB545E4|nr:fasciclin domain-containing protein [Agaribacterium haliotis]
MNFPIKLIAPAFLSVLLVACGGDDDDDPAPEPTPEAMSVFDVARDDGGFSTLVTTLEATGLDETLDDLNSTFTVFAPTDAAFDALGQDTLNALLADTDTLSDILLYHVISGTEVDAAAATAAAGSSVAMANGDNAAISAMTGMLYIDGALITMTDIEADNGVIHVLDAVMSPPKSIVDVAVENGSFNTLVAALQASGLDQTLADLDTNFTVFAPTDDAFAALPDGTLDTLLADAEGALTDVLLYHVLVDSVVDSSAAIAAAGSSIEMASGEQAALVLDGGNLFIAGAQVVLTDVMTDNGLIHVIDAVMLPPAEAEPEAMSIVDVAEENGSFTTLIAALEATGLDAVLDDDSRDFTVFAPTDAAFELLGSNTINALLADTETLSDILLYHVIADAEVDSAAALASAGSTVTMANTDALALSYVDSVLYVNTAMVTLVDVEADNGVIHVIDAVLMPPAAMATPSLDIVDTAIDAGSFTTLVAALQAAGLDGILRNTERDFTVFAPTDAAFAALPEGTLDALLADPGGDLTTILLNHVIADASIDSISAMTLNGQQAGTAAEQLIDISIVDGQLTVGGATVTGADVYTTNGVIHVIDAVIVD